MFGKKDISNDTFGPVRFINGWQASERFEITLWGRQYNVFIRATAIDKKELITTSQEKAFCIFSHSHDVYSELIEHEISEHFPELSEEEKIKRFIPEEIVFARDGSIGICIGDNEDEDCSVQPDADIAIQLYPNVVFYDSQEQYLAFLD